MSESKNFNSTELDAGSSRAGSSGAGNPDTVEAAPENNATEDATLYCANHPNTETLLRCNRCEKPICLKCSKLTDVGYRCNDCLRNVQDKYFNAESRDNPIAFAVAFGVTFIATPFAGFLMGLFGFLSFLLAFVLGSGAGGALAQIIRQSIGKRRGRYLRYFALAGIICGFLLGLFASLLLLGFLPGLLPLLIFAFLTASTAVTLLR